jgi:hypothetical protein
VVVPPVVVGIGAPPPFDPPPPLDLGWVVVGGGAEDVVVGVGGGGAEEVVGAGIDDVVVSGTADEVVVGAGAGAEAFLAGLWCWGFFFLAGSFFLWGVVVVVGVEAAEVLLELELLELPQPASTTAAATVVSSARFMDGAPLCARRLRSSG